MMNGLKSEWLYMIGILLKEKSYGKNGVNQEITMKKAKQIRDGKVLK